MLEVSESIGKPEIVNLLIDVLDKITDRTQENYSGDLVVAYFKGFDIKYDPRILRMKKCTRKWMGVIPMKYEKKTALIVIDTSDIKNLRKITVQMNDAFIYPIAKDEITKFAESNKEANIKEVAYVKNFSASP